MFRKPEPLTGEEFMAEVARLAELGERVALIRVGRRRGVWIVLADISVAADALIFRHAHTTPVGRLARRYAARWARRLTAEGYTVTVGVL